MSLKVWRGSLTWTNQCTMSATLTQGFKHNLISISRGKSHIYIELVSFHSQQHWETHTSYSIQTWHCLGQSQSHWSWRQTDNETGPLLHSHSSSSPWGNVVVCASACKTKKPIYTDRLDVCSLSAVAAPRTAHLTIQAWRGGRVILENKQCVWHSTETHSTLLCVFGGEKKKFKHAAIVGMWTPDVKWNTYNFYCIVSWYISWFLVCSDVIGMRECSMNAGAGTVKAFTEPRPWLPGICPDESWTGLRICWSLPHPSLPECVCECASVWMQADMPQRGCRLSTFSSSEQNVEGCAVRGKMKKWDSASLWQIWVGESWFQY